MQPLEPDGVFSIAQEFFGADCDLLDTVEDTESRVWRPDIRRSAFNSVRAFAVAASVMFIGLAHLSTTASRPFQTRDSRTHAGTDVGAAVHQRLAALGQLPPDWDSYGGRSISTEVIRRVAAFVDEVLRRELPPPAVVPTSLGGIQLEWESPTAELEVEFVPGERRVTVLVDSLEAGAAMEEAVVEPRLDKLALYFDKLYKTV